MMEIFLQVLSLVGGVGAIIFVVKHGIKIVSTVDVLEDTIIKLFYQIDEKDTEITELNDRFNKLVTATDMVINKEINSPYVVQYIKKPKKDSYIRLIYKSNKNCFLHSETYKNHKFAFLKAQELSRILNCNIEIIDK